MKHRQNSLKIEALPVREAKGAESAERASGGAINRAPKISSLKRKLFMVLTLVASTVLTYSICEAVYRYSEYRQLVSGKVHPDVVTESPTDRFDPQTGYSYIPNTRTRYQKFTSDGEPLPVDNVIRFNNKGHVSWNDDRVEKPASEFRIAVLGDSFTAALEMSKPWPDVLEELLNQDPDLKQKLGISTFNVINFGQDGIGIIQCAEIHRHKVSLYDADLVALNFISDDVLRSFTHRTTVERDMGDFRYHVTVHTYSLPCTLENPGSFLGTVSLARRDFEATEKWKRLRQDIGRLQLRRVRWFSLYPELIASKIGNRIGLPPRLFNPYELSQYLDDESGYDLAVQACRRIKNTSKDALFLYIPAKWEIPVQQTATAQNSSTVRRILALAPDLDVTDMGRYFARELSDPRDVERCFIPKDGHFSDYGGRVYAQAVYRKLKQHLSVSRTR